MPRLTKTTVDGTRPKDKQYTVWCSDLRGFGVFIQPTGVRTYFVDYRSSEGTRRRMTIGRHCVLTTEEARKLAVGHLGTTVRGEDPALERKTRRASLTVAELCDNYFAAADKGLIFGKNGRPKKASTIYSDKGRIERHVKPLLGKKLVTELKASDIAKFIRDVTAGKTVIVEVTAKKRGKSVVTGGSGTASRTTGLLGGILTFAMSEGIIDANPVRGVQKPKDKKRERRLTPDEYRALGAALTAADAESWQGRAGIWLLALTGARLGDIRELKRHEIDFEGRCLRLGDSKTNETVRPLGEPAFEVLRCLPVTVGTPYALPGERDPSKPISVIDDILDRVVVSAGLEGVTAHVLRHSFASVAADLNYSDSTIGVIIGHAGETTTSRYTHRLDTVLIAAANKIAGEVYRQMTDESSNGAEIPYAG